MNTGNVKKCPDCDKKLIKIRGEGYDVSEARHCPFVFGRICKNCKKLYINPDFSNYVLVKVGDVGR